MNDGLSYEWEIGVVNDISTLVEAEKTALEHYFKYGLTVDVAPRFGHMDEVYFRIDG